MENKAKFLIIGLIGFLLLSVIISLQTYATKESLKKERDRLIGENAELTKVANDSQQKARSLESKVTLLNEDLKKLSKDKEDFQKKFDLLSKEKEELIARLKSQKQASAASGQGEMRQAVVSSGVSSATEDTYWAGILKAKTDLELQLGTLRSELKAAQVSNEQLQRERSTLQLDLNALKRDKDDLQRQVEYNKKILDSIAADLVRERNDKIKIVENIKTLKNENEVLTRQLKSLNTCKYTLEKKLSDLQEDKATVERRFSEMESRLSEKVSMINDLKVELEDIRSGTASRQEEIAPSKESVELPPIVVRPQAEDPEVRIQQGSTVLGGKVLAINRDSNFVIIDLGEDAGVKIGDAFRVYREDKTVANLEVIQTRKNIAACDIKAEMTPIKIGDTVR